jgi:hypothetical protein
MARDGAEDLRDLARHQTSRDVNPKPNAMKKSICIFLDENGPLSALQLWYAGKKNVPVHSWVEVRGDVTRYDPGSMFHKIHDLRCINVSSLHAGQVVQILSDTEGYALVRQIVDEE